MIVAFLSVALLSTGLLGVLGWQLLKQDRELHKTRLEERRAQVYDALLAWMHDASIATANAVADRRGPHHD